MITQEEFTNRLMGCMVFGLSEKQAEGLVTMGKDACDYFERAVLALEYELFKNAPKEMTLDEWAMNHPKVVKEIYLEKESGRPLA